MGTLYERITELCKAKGISGSRMCLDLGLSKSTLSDIKSGRKKGISTATAQKMAAYLGVSVGYLLGEETEKASADDGKRSASKEDIMFALFRGREDVTEEMYEEVQNFADFVAQREAAKKNKG